MNNNEAEIQGEHVALFEAQEGANAEALREFLSQSVGEFGFKLRVWGSEKTMRLMLVDRANFIENSVSSNES